MVRFYEKQGFYRGTFIPVVGKIIYDIIKDVKKGDSVQTWKNFFTKNPHLKNIPGIVDNFGSNVVIMVIDPDLTGELLKNPTLYEKDPFILEVTQEILGNGLFFQEGDEWKNNRKFLSNIFNFGLIKDNIGYFSQISSNAFNSVQLQNDDLNVNQNKPVELLPFIEKITASVIIQVFLGPQISNSKINGISLPDFIIDFFKNIMDVQLSPLYFILGKRFFTYNLRKIDREFNKKRTILRQEFIRIAKEEIENFKQNKKGVDYVSIVKLLFEDKKENFNLDDPKQQEYLLAEIFIFLLAGKDTTMFLAQMCLYYLAKQPQIQAKIRSEFEGKSVTNDDIKQMTYLDGFVNEVLRTYGPVLGLATRRVNQTHKLGKFEIRKGISIGIGTTFNHHNPEYYQNPFEIQPERWMDEKEKQVKTFAFTPFSGGPRSCIGNILAKIEVKVIILSVIQSFSSILIPDSYHLKLSIQNQYAPTQPVPFILSRRELNEQISIQQK